MKAKQRGALLFAGLVTIAVGAHAGVSVGDAHDDVISRLGAPDGYIKTETVSWLYYERGTVKLQDGRVIDVELQSPEQWARQREREREAQARLQAERAEWHAARLRQGWELKQVRQSDPRFLAAPASEQVAFWRVFRSRYPEIAVHEEYALALERYQVEQERALREREQERRIRELEERVRRAEERALARSYSGPHRTVYHAGPRVIHVHHVPHVAHRMHPVWPVTVLPGPAPRNRPIRMSHADHVFGPMPAIHSSGFHCVGRSSSFSGSLRVSF